MDEFDAGDKVFETLLTWLYEGKPNVEMLLQIYFLHSHYLKQKEYDGEFIVDRDIIEHWLFANENLKSMPEVSNMYNGLFAAYMNGIKKPDLYIILNISYDEFKKRLMKRGRKSEIDNFDANEEYFKNLLDTYVSKLMAQCTIYDIPYHVINVDYRDEDDVLDHALSYVKYLLPKIGVKNG